MAHRRQLRPPDRQRGQGVPGGVRAAADGVAGPATYAKIYALQDPDCTPLHFSYAEVDGGCGAGGYAGGSVSAATVKENLKRAMWRAEALRQRIGNMPLTVTSGFRSQACDRSGRRQRHRPAHLRHRDRPGRRPVLHAGPERPLQRLRRHLRSGLPRPRRPRARRHPRRPLVERAELRRSDLRPPSRSASHALASASVAATPAPSPAPRGACGVGYGLGLGGHRRVRHRAGADAAALPDRHPRRRRRWSPGSWWCCPRPGTSCSTRSPGGSATAPSTRAGRAGPWLLRAGHRAGASPSRCSSPGPTSTRGCSRPATCWCCSWPARRRTRSSRCRSSRCPPR